MSLQCTSEYRRRRSSGTLFARFADHLEAANEGAPQGRIRQEFLLAAAPRLAEKIVHLREDVPEIIMRLE